MNCASLASWTQWMDLKWQQLHWSCVKCIMMDRFGWLILQGFGMLVQCWCYSWLMLDTMHHIHAVWRASPFLVRRLHWMHRLCFQGESLGLFLLHETSSSVCHASNVLHIRMCLVLLDHGQQSHQLHPYSTTEEKGWWEDDLVLRLWTNFC